MAALYYSMEEEPTFDEYRVGYVSTRWNVSHNCARALQLFELGFTTSGAATVLDVTEGTTRSYMSELCDKISDDVVWSVGGDKPRRDVWGEGGTGHAHGERDGSAKRSREQSVQATTSKEQIDAKFREREIPLNKGIEFEEIPKDLITIAPNVDVEQ